MAILIDKDTKVLVQGITGHQGKFHSKAMIDLGTKVVAGVTPGKGGERVNGVRVFDDVKTAVEKTGANASVVFVPALMTRDSVIEAIDAGIKLITIITEHVPFQDMLKINEYAKLKDVKIIGPNCPGLAAPGIGKLGIIPNTILKKGVVGVISRSGTLTYEIVNVITETGLGESTVLGIGGDKVPGIGFIDALKLFKQDEQTKAVVIVGEIGGDEEEKAAEFIRKEFDKPVVAFIDGIYAPPGKRMGHAGAIISGKTGTAESKLKAFKKANVPVAKNFKKIATYLINKI
ncbi:MAG: succinyl-CoA synthetase, alpha subunit [Candidatus Parvarchaeum acidiphilum ARMAN-4]|uniref:Succinate--CoA ligase [ADP-forming] subunit alpha n=1 Tax=Candidatus Parvarchaeum acidiphilum ARMAN-4 TaxID=662760 RepID=D2EFN6_PARA4|nr:MAG: succinyl-CoA synthetase, alpha subunit [Candidatus Parvarchaeum acidiphilum ARMAN-4]